MKWNKKYDWPKIKTATASEFFEEIEEKHGNELEVYRAAWPDWWTDGFGSGAREVSKSRSSHVDIIASQAGFAEQEPEGGFVIDNENFCFNVQEIIRC